jgi:hypothetical protein
MEVLYRFKNRLHATIHEILNTSFISDGNPVGSEVKCVHEAKDIATTSGIVARSFMPLQSLDAYTNERNTMYIYHVAW